MLSRFFKRRADKDPASGPPDCVIWAVGDIHGRLDLAEVLVTAVRADLAKRQTGRRILIFLGDHVDRGLNARGVLDLLCEVACDPSLESYFIRGNHEDRMEAFLTEPDVGPGWCDYGGRETLQSYGVNAPAMRGDAQGWTETSQALNQALPESHRALLRRQHPSLALGDYFFAHAGARPGIPLEAQSPDDLMWIRDAFLNDNTPFEKVIVHGHTPSETVYSDGRRIGIDTGAYATNILSAVRLDGVHRVALHVTGRGPQIRASTTVLANV